MASDVMRVRLHLREIRVLEVIEDTPGALVVEVESTLLRLRCARCREHPRREAAVKRLGRGTTGPSCTRCEEHRRQPHLRTGGGSCSGSSRSRSTRWPIDPVSLTGHILVLLRNNRMLRG